MQPSTPDQALLHRGVDVRRPVVSRFSVVGINFPLDTKVVHDVSYNKLGNGNSSTETITATFDNNRLDNIRRIHFGFRVGEVSVAEQWKGKIEICWTNRFVHHMVGNTILTSRLNKDGTSKQTGTFFTDAIWGDLNYTYFIKNKESYDDDIGMLDNMCSWSSSLPATDVIHTLPLIWSNHLSQSFPIHDNAGDVVLNSSFTLTLHDQIIKYLRVRIRTDKPTANGDGWIYIKPTDSISRYLAAPKTVSMEFVSRSDDVDDESDTESVMSATSSTGTRRPRPRMNGARHTRIHRDRRRNGTMQGSKHEQALDHITYETKPMPLTISVEGTKQDPDYIRSHVASKSVTSYYTYDVVPLVKDEMQPGSKKLFTIRGGDLHHTLYFLARNLKAERSNYYSNYTTNSVDHLQGYNPIEHVRIIVGDIVVFDGNSTTLRKVAKGTFPAYSEEHGYNAHSFSFNPVSPYNDTSYVSNGKSIITVEVTLRTLEDHEEDTRFGLTIYSNAKRQVVHDRKLHDIKVLKGGFVRT